MPISGPNNADTKTDSGATVQDVDPGQRTPPGQTALELRTAARFLGISPEALRKRIQRGKVKAYKEDGRWLVVLDSPDKVSRGVRTVPVDRAGQTEAAHLSDLYERLITATEEATRYKALCEVSESTRRETEEHYRAQIAELQAHVNELEQRRRPWWRRGKHEQET